MVAPAGESAEVSDATGFDIQMGLSNRYAGELPIAQGKHRMVAPGAVDKQVISSKPLALKSQLLQKSQAAKVFWPYVSLDAMQVDFRRESKIDDGRQSLAHKTPPLKLSAQCITQHGILKGAASNCGQPDATHQDMWLVAKAKPPSHRRTGHGIHLGLDQSFALKGFSTKVLRFWRIPRCQVESVAFVKIDDPFG